MYKLRGNDHELLALIDELLIGKWNFIKHALRADLLHFHPMKPKSYHELFCFDEPKIEKRNSKLRNIMLYLLQETESLSITFYDVI